MMRRIRVEEYKPIAGFVDLRRYSLTRQEFKKCVAIQKFLAHVEENKGYYKKFLPEQYERAKCISAELLLFLKDRELPSTFLSIH